MNDIQRIALLGENVHILYVFEMIWDFLFLILITENAVFQGLLSYNEIPERPNHSPFFF